MFLNCHYWKHSAFVLSFVGMLTCGGCSKSDRPNFPPDVLEMRITVDTTDKALFSTEYYILPDGPLQSRHPEEGTRFEERLSFDGSIVPLAITTSGEFRYPLRVFVTPMPLKRFEVSYWKPGMHVNTAHGELYRYKLRADETGLCVGIFVQKTNTVHVFPADMKPLNVRELPGKAIEDSELTIKCLEIPDPSTLPLAPQHVVDMVTVK